MTAKARVKQLEKQDRKKDSDEIKVFILWPDGSRLHNGRTLTPQEYEAMRGPNDTIIKVTYTGDE